MNEPLKPEPRRCSWGFHRWSVWGAPYKQPMIVPGVSAPGTFETRQERTCLACGRVDRREII